MKKIFYWSPYLSNVATIKNVINSAKSIKKFDKSGSIVSLIDVIGEWKNYKKLIFQENIHLVKLSGFDLSRFFPITGFIKTRLSFLFIFFFKYIPLKNLINKEKPDFLIIHLVTSLPLILLLKNNYNTKFILRISGLPKLTIFRKILWKLIAKKIYLVTCPSKETQRDIIKEKIFSENKIKVLYDPILQIKLIKNQSKEKNIIPENDKNKYFLNIGRLTKQKNQVLLISAFSKLKKKKDNLKLYLIGDGENKKFLTKKINQLGLKESVFLKGHINNVFPLIRDSLAIIVTSLWEDPGAVMVEGSFMKKNIISSNCPNGPYEFLNQGKAGYLFENNNENQLINSINNFLNDNDKDKKTKILYARKNSKNYTMFNHFKNISEILDLK